jgi:hypothetical protein
MTDNVDTVQSSELERLLRMQQTYRGSEQLAILAPALAREVLALRKQNAQAREALEAAKKGILLGPERNQHCNLCERGVVFDGDDLPHKEDCPMPEINTTLAAMRGGCDDAQG